MKSSNVGRTMASTLALLLCMSDAVEAFNSSPPESLSRQTANVRQTIVPSSTVINAATLAVSFEEDLALTRQIIMDHEARSTTVSKEQFIQQMEELAKPAESSKTESTTTKSDDTTDLSVPYDATARLAYDSLGDEPKVSFDEFQTKYLADAVAEVKAKQEGGEDFSALGAANTKRSRLRRIVTWVRNKTSKKQKS